LLELADAARLSGRPAEAARAFDRLLRAHRGDPRAGLAALELGRLRMDNLGDPAGALEAFSDAVALAKSGAVREDAEARRVQALERLGDIARCVRARDAYLERFPGGIHASSIRRRCTTK
jgi:tetratricopeptide (TPR) repeat protein